MSAAKRLRFEAGEWASEVNGALWSLEDRKAPDGKRIPGIDSTRVANIPAMRRIVVAVDPSGTKGDGGGDDIGIVVAGLGEDGRGYVLEDGTVQLSPEGWGRRAVDLYHKWDADRIIGERNYGGDMVRFTVSTADKKAAFKEVSASRGKHVRAEPISALYEQGKVSHVGYFPDLEDQMCLAAGTLIETDCGMIAIENITTHHRVLTRNGFAPIKWAGYTGTATEFVEIEAGTCRIRATRSHPIFDTVTGEFVSAANVSPSQRLLVSRRWESMEGQSHGGGSGITGCHLAITDTRRGSFCIARFTKRIAGLFQRGWMSITSTATPATMILKTLSLEPGRSTSLSTHPSATRVMRKTPRSALVSHVVRKPDQSAQSQAPTALTDATCVFTVLQGLPDPSLVTPASAAGPQVKPSGNGSSAPTDVRPITMLRHTQSASEPVYNLSVEDGYLPEFFANGILVHNCNFTASGYIGDNSPDRADALVWALSELMFGGSTYNINALC